METFYLVGGGPSLLGFDWSRLHGKRCIAINRSWEVLPWAEYLYFTDARFWDHNHANIESFKGRIATGSGVERLTDPRIEKYRFTGPDGLDPSPSCLRHGNCSGYAAINLAHHLGARRIILLGYDMKPIKLAPDDPLAEFHGETLDGKVIRTHWHSGYPTSVRERTYINLAMHFPTLVGPAYDLGLEIINACPGSVLECFPKMTIDEALQL